MRDATGRQTSGASTAFHQLSDFTATPAMLRIAALAVPVGALGAVAAWGLQRLIGLITNLVFYGTTQSTLVAPGAAQHSPWIILLAPVAGGLAVGLMARFGSERIRGHGMPEAIEAILIGGSRVEPRVALLKPVSAATAIGTGGPFGAEGPIIMTGGAIGSLLAQLLHLTADERKTLLVAGAAAGMAATFNAPLASILLAVELLLFEWRPRSYVPVAVAVAVATALRAPLLGSGAVFAVAHVALHLGATVDALCVVSGLLAGLLALVATRLVYAAEDGFRRLPLHWMWWPAIGGAIIGVGGLIVPQALGVGYDVIHAELTGHIGLSLVVGILVVKTLIWSLSLGSGTSGGVLAPMFMVGGALGALEATVFPPVAPGFWALIGLAGVLGGLMRSPLTGVVFAVELTHRFDAILPLVISASAAYALSVLVLRRSVLTEKVARRGFHLTREYDVDPLEVLFVREVMAAPDEVTTFVAGTPLAVAADEMRAELESDDGPLQRLYPLLDGARLAGVVPGRALLRVLAGLETHAPDAPVDVLARVDPVVAHEDETARQVAYRMAEHGYTRMPVVARDDHEALLGIVSIGDLLEGRLRDLDEARRSERLLRLALPRFSRRPGGRPSASPRSKALRPGTPAASSARPAG